MQNVWPTVATLGQGRRLFAGTQARSSITSTHPGVAVQGIAYHCGISDKCVRVHINQINDMLAATRVKIGGGGGGVKYGSRKEYRIIRSAPR